jgi:hypothetical protein
MKSIPPDTLLVCGEEIQQRMDKMTKSLEAGARMRIPKLQDIALTTTM